MQIENQRNAVTPRKRQEFVLQLAKLPVEPLCESGSVGGISTPSFTDRIHLAPRDCRAPFLERPEVVLAHGELRQHDAARLRAPGCL